MSQMDQLKEAGDVAAYGLTLGALLGWLPAIAAVVSIIYGCLRIYEWIEKRRDRNDA